MPTRDLILTCPRRRTSKEASRDRASSGDSFQASAALRHLRMGTKAGDPQISVATFRDHTIEQAV
jgi:hypothetical protein